jgi:dipeptidyl aminopeptidase/acylaminoacyl peptidase
MKMCIYIYIHIMPASSRQLPPLIPRAVLFGTPAVDTVRISPDGAQIAYLAPHNGGQSAWVRTLGGADDRIVATADRPLSWLRWQPDGQHILYLQDASGDENYRLLRVDLSGGIPERLTPAEHIRAMPLRLDPRFPTSALVTLNLRDRRLPDVHRIDFATGEAPLDTENPGDVLGWLADNHYVIRAAIAHRPDGSYAIRVRDDTSASWRTLDTTPLDDGPPRLVAFGSDESSLYVVSAKDANTNRLVCYDLASDTRGVVFEHDTYDVESVYIDPSSRQPVAVAVLEDRLVWTALEEGFEQDLAALRQVHRGDFTIEDAGADGGTLIVRYSDDLGADQVYVYERLARRASLAFDVRPDLAGYALAPMQPITLTARDGLELHGYLTVPRGVEPEALPTVVYVHGGPWLRDRWGYEPVVQWLANRGYAVVQINFRGSTGYGKSFRQAGDREWAGAMRTDLLDARDWAVKTGLADPARIGIIGASYGGYAVLTALTWTPDAFACGIDLMGPSDLTSFIASIPPYWEWMRRLLAARIGDDPEMLKSQSPLYRASAIRAPLLIVQGANDPRVKQKESDQIARALEGGAVPVQYVLFDDEGHGIGNPANLVRFAATAEPFLAAALGGRVEHAPH